MAANFIFKARRVMKVQWPCNCYNNVFTTHQSIFTQLTNYELLFLILLKLLYCALWFQYFQLRGYRCRISSQKLSCFVLFLKIINIKKITQAYCSKLSKDLKNTSKTFCVIDPNNIFVVLMQNLKTAWPTKI